MWLCVSNRMIARLYFSWVYIPNERTQESGHLTPITGPYVSRWRGVYQVVPPSFRNALRIVSSGFQTTSRRQEEIKQVWGQITLTSQPSDVSSSNSLITFLPLFLKNHYWNHPDSWPTLDLPKVIGALEWRSQSKPKEMDQAQERWFNQRWGQSESKCSNQKFGYHYQVLDIYSLAIPHICS